MHTHNAIVEALENRTLLSASPHPGSLDASFGNAGLVTGSGMSVSGQSVAIQPDGKTLVAGTADVAGVESFSVIRYNTDGSVDTTFGNAGTATVNIDGQGDTLTGIALQSDGKIVVVGDNGLGAVNGSSILLARFNADGTLDTTFGTGGKVIAARADNYDTASAVQIAPDGTIVVVGTGAETVGYSSQLLIERFNADGSADSAFGNNGQLLTQAANSVSSEATGLAIESDGDIIVSAVGDSTIPEVAVPKGYVLRYNPDGSLDTTFAGNSEPVKGLVNPGQVLVESDGDILIAGSAPTKKDGNKFALACLNADGTLDRKFGDHGLASTSFGTYRSSPDHTRSGADAIAYAVAVEPDGTLIVSGTDQTTNVGIAVVAYKSNGRLLQRFGKNGKVIAASGSSAGQPDVAVGPDGLPVVAGSTGQQFFVARYTAA